MLPSHVISDLAQVLEQMAKTLTSTSLSKEPSLTASVHELDLATECLRCLRNSCADCRSNQEAVSRYGIQNRYECIYTVEVFKAPASSSSIL